MQSINREIKFRAWDGKGMLNIDHWTLSMINQYIPEGHIIEQYTGLKDKNGGEIYEGDLIKECTKGSVIWDEEGVIEECPIGKVIITPYHTTVQQLKDGKVRLLNKDSKFYEIHNRGKGFGDVNLSTYDGLYQWPADIEIIGNIHQNKELIS